MQLNHEAIIMFLGLVIVAAFEKNECESCIKKDFFPFADWKVLWTEYAYQSCMHIVVVAFTSVLYLKDRNRLSLISLALMIGWYLNYALRANFRFFTFFGYPFGYTAFAALIFALCLLIQMMNGLSRLRH